jgi:hypothetical protein
VNGTVTESGWNALLGSKDRKPPVFLVDTFVGQINKINPFPILSIQAQDDPTGENVTGLNTSSARFRVTYNSTTDDDIESDWYNATTNGSLGTKNKILINADLSDLDDRDNITAISAIQFMIMDIVGNENQTDFLSITNDSKPPSSFITNVESIDAFVNASFVEIIVNATDHGSGIKDVGLYYKKSDETQWRQFQSKKIQEPFEWDFTIGSNAGGNYSLRSIATDNAGNIEEKEGGEVSFVFDPNEPTLPSFSSTLIFTADTYNETEVPVFSDFTFRDDYLLESVSYRMNFEATNAWRMINSEPINTAQYQPTWNITPAQWDMMEEDITYSIYFRVEDSLGNINTADTSVQALKIRKNFITDTPETPLVTPDLTDFDSWKWDNAYRIEVDSNTTDYQSVTLYYAYSEKNTTNLTFKVYNESFDNESKSWMFIPTDGDGYYSFKIEMIDSQGSLITSDIKTVYIQQFPMLELMVIIILAIVLFAVTAVLYQRRRKTVL